MDTVELRVDLGEWTTVRATLAARPNPAFEAASGSAATTIELDASAFVEVLEVSIDGETIAASATDGFDHDKASDQLKIAEGPVGKAISGLAGKPAVPASAAGGEEQPATFSLEIVSKHKPADNTELSGLYKAQGGKMFIT